MDIRITDYQSTSAAGTNLTALRASIDAQQSGLRINDLPGIELDTWIGRVTGLEEIQLGEWQSRNNALAYLGLQQGSLLANVEELKAKFGGQRLAVVMGSSTSSIDRTEVAYQQLDEQTITEQFQQPRVHNPGAPSLFVAHQTGITGPSLTINTACSSSAKVFATGARWLNAGIVDAVLVGGVDTLCMSVLYGFDSLQLVSANPCAPFDRARDGINLGEAAGYAILLRDADCSPAERQNSVQLVGYGESSDAHHMSHPHPDGLGARLAMEQALESAKLKPEQIDYVNLHGTASRANDLIEGRLIASMFPASTQVSSTKAWMGHTLGAAGITEALIAVDSLQRQLVPGSMNLHALDDALSLSIQADNLHRDCRYVMSNSFGFGGNNCCLAFAHAEA